MKPGEVDLGMIQVEMKMEMARRQEPGTVQTRTGLGRRQKVHERGTSRVMGQDQRTSTVVAGVGLHLGWGEDERRVEGWCRKREGLLLKWCGGKLLVLAAL